VNFGIAGAAPVYRSVPDTTDPDAAAFKGKKDELRVNSAPQRCVSGRRVEKRRVRLVCGRWAG